MIQLSRPLKPQELVENEVTLTNEFILDKKKIVWNKKYIRAALLSMSNEKCCYCECKVGSGEREMHVEHFKPKSLYPDLVVNWDNLLPSCPHCNKQKSDHDTVAEPIVNPVNDNPKKYFYLKDYRYYCFDNTENSVARRTLGVLSLNDTTENVYKRYLIGNELHNKIDEIFEYAIENEKDLKAKTTKRNKIYNACRDIMRYGLPDAVYSAFMATIIYYDSNFTSCVNILKKYNFWDSELEDLYKKIRNNSFLNNRVG